LAFGVHEAEVKFSQGVALVGQRTKKLKGATPNGVSARTPPAKIVVIRCFKVRSPRGQQTQHQ
jgi:hypothetical protein